MPACLPYVCVMLNNMKLSHKDAFIANQSTVKHSKRLMDVPLYPNRLKNSKENGKFNVNDMAMAIGNRKKRHQQIRRRSRHQPIDSTLNTVVQKHETIIPKREANRQSAPTTKHHIIPEENVIIGICTKLFRKCFFPSSSATAAVASTLPASMVSVKTKLIKCREKCGGIRKIKKYIKKKVNSNQRDNTEKKENNFFSPEQKQ